MPAVGVVIPTYNRPALLRRAVASVLAQTFADLELVVVDDGSTGDSLCTATEVGDGRLRCLRQENAGPCAARNLGAWQVKGAYVAFLDDDDAWLPEKLARQVDVLEQRPEVGLVACGWRTVDPEGRVLGESRPWQRHARPDLGTWLHGCPVIPSVAVVRRTWLEAVGGFDQEVRFLEDWDWGLRLASAGCRMGWAEDVLCTYRLTPLGRMSGRTDHAEWVIRVLDRHYSRPEVPPESLALRESAYSRAHLRAAAWEVYHGHPQAAETHIEEALRLQPHLQKDAAQALLTGLAVLAAEPVISEPEALCRDLAASVPSAVGVSGRWRRRMRGYGAFQGLFRAQAAHDWRRAARCLRALAIDEPRRLLDLGVLSVAAETALGRRAAAWVRSAYRRLLTVSPRRRSGVSRPSHESNAPDELRGQAGDSVSG